MPTKTSRSLRKKLIKSRKQLKNQVRFIHQLHDQHEKEINDYRTRIKELEEKNRWNFTRRLKYLFTGG